MTELTTPHEDYLERIGELIKQKGYARVSDIAEKLDVSPASVSKMLQRLEQLGYVKTEKYRGLALTEKGKIVGRNISKRHAILNEFLSLLNIPERVIKNDIEGLEHHLSDQTVKAIELLIEKIK